MHKIIIPLNIAQPKLSAGMGHETNDCSIRAAVAITGAKYIDAHAAMEKLGRRPRKGVSTQKLVTALDSGNFLGCSTKRVPGIDRPRGKNGCQWTLATFVRLLPKGKFFCLMRGHAFAIIDGVLHDQGRVKPGARIFAAWQVFDCPVQT